MLYPKIEIKMFYQRESKCYVEIKYIFDWSVFLWFLLNACVKASVREDPEKVRLENNFEISALFYN